MRRLVTGLCALGLTLSWTACGGPQSRVTKGVVNQTLDQSPDKGSFLEAIGIGASDPTLTTDTQRKALSRDAAIVKAQYEMLSMVKGVQLQGGISVQQAIENDSTLQTKINELIKGAEIVKTEYTADNGCVVTLRLPKKRLSDMMNVKFN
jgi:hypothetical protein